MRNHSSMTESFIAEEAIIMIIDDSLDSLRLLSEILLIQGFQVRQALSGHAALPVIKQQHPDLIILDIRMPEMDGFEVCRELKNDAETSDIPVIFISNLDQVTDKIQAFEVGGQDYITKPFEVTEVLARVKRHLELNRLKQSLEDMVQQRTIKLEESNTALKVLLDYRKSEQEKFEENVVRHISTLISPYMKRMQETNLDSQQIALMDIIESNLTEITANFSGKLYSKALGLTRREMEIASLIKTGKTNVEIAVILSISEHAVSFHRQNLRKKLGLLGQKVNLLAYLHEITLT